jgi:transposase
VRDLLRRRLLFVKHRTSHILSLQSMISRNLGTQMAANAIKRLDQGAAETLFDSPHLVLAAKSNIAVIHFLKERIKLIEKAVKSQLTLREEFTYLLTVPGIGDILALTIMAEVGDIARFPRVGDYSSYCRCVKSERLSNGKKNDENKRKNGNRYLSWAYVEAANFAIRFSPSAQAFYQKKMAKTNGIVAIKALGNKLARASYYMMRDQVPYDPGKLFR